MINYVNQLIQLLIIIHNLGNIINYVFLNFFSGITSEHLKNVTTNLIDIQNDLLNIIFEDTILIGQSLSSDLKALRVL